MRDLAIAAHHAGVGFAIGAKRIAALWRTLAGVGETDWVEAIDMPHAQVTVADYRPAWWPTDTRRRRALHPDQRVLPLDELADTDAVYGYSFILTNLDVSTPAKAAAVEHWYRHRAEIENITSLCFSA